MARGIVIYGLLVAGLVALLGGQGGIAIVLIGFALVGASAS